MADIPAQTPIYDISGSKPILGDIPHEQVQEALASGKYSLPKGDINVFNPEGELGSLPAEQASEAFKNGYTYATPKMVEHHDKLQKYGTTGQQTLAGAETVGRGALGPLAPLAERGLGVSPEAMESRKEIFEEEHPVLSPVLETAGLIGSEAIPGIGQAGLLAKAGDLAAHGIEATSMATKMANRAAKLGTELAAMQAGDETSKYLMNAPDSTAGMAANIGLSAVLGAGLGAGTSALAQLGGKALSNSHLSEFIDRYKARLEGLNPTEALMDEASKAYDVYNHMGSEIGGVNGLKAAAIDNLVPEMHDGIRTQVTELSDKMSDLIKKHPEYEKELGSQKAALDGAINPPRDPMTNKTLVDIPPSQVFETMDGIKRQLGEWGKFNRDMVPLKEQPFRNAARSLGHDFKLALEDSKAWGEAGSLQKTLNDAWSTAIPGTKDFEKKFLQKTATGDYLIDPSKFSTYMNQNGKATTKTVRQQMMGKFVDGLEKFQQASDKAYESAGVESPHAPLSLGGLKESVGKQSFASNFADKMYEKLVGNAGGELLGGAIGGAAGHSTGIPGAGLMGTWFGGKVGESVLPSITRPLLEKVVNSKALQRTVNLQKEAIKGDKLIKSAAENLFKGGLNTQIRHLQPSKETLDKLDATVHEYASNPGYAQPDARLAHYSPDHASELSMMSGRAVSYLDSLKPRDTQASILDTKLPPSSAQKESYYRQLAIAEQPILVMQKINDGTLAPQDIQTIQTIYPALYNRMANEVRMNITQHSAEGNTIPYTTRQAASLFLQMPLDSTMVPSSIASAQGVFAQHAQQPQNQPMKVKKASGTRPLTKMANAYKTPGQTAESDRSSRG